MVVLSWDANAEPDLAGYRVYRSTTSGTGYAEISSGLITWPAHLGGGLTNGTTYFYFLMAEDPPGNLSGDSNAAWAAPTGVAGDVAQFGSAAGRDRV